MSACLTQQLWILEKLYAMFGMGTFRRVWRWHCLTTESPPPAASWGVSAVPPKIPRVGIEVLIGAAQAQVVVGQQFVVPSYSKVSLLPQPINQDSDEELEYADSSSGAVESQSINDSVDVANGEPTPNSSDTPEVGISGAGYIWSLCEGGHEEEWRHSIAPIPADKLSELAHATQDELDLAIQDGSILPPSGELVHDSDGTISENDDNEDSKDDNAYFEKEVEATFLRAVHEGVEQNHVILEVNSLRLSYNLSSTHCAGAIFYSVMKLAVETPHASNSELFKNAASAITKWHCLLTYYLQSIDEEIEIIMKFEEMCMEYVKEFSPLFAQILHFLYEKNILQEEAILSWASEKEGADESDKVFVKQSEAFIQWLKEAPEEDEDEEDD
ncbi:translation initiation factor eIF-2B subunit epsilon-like [Macadamia integrifolia]|uniref:translation initiation factor eIF-2B subunit epsilon-like n=1 Tax=Macadamia integrifolia TaxID=60698 RepID=UPI001C4E38F8|nr:translation initiation factor eIF-2B subunit epsilon-like [Macadamia integrifolia]